LVQYYPIIFPTEGYFCYAVTQKNTMLHVQEADLQFGEMMKKSFTVF